MNITLNELKFLIPRVALYSAASYAGVWMAQTAIGQTYKLLVGQPKTETIDIDKLDV